MSDEVFQTSFVLSVGSAGVFFRKVDEFA